MSACDWQVLLPQALHCLEYAEGAENILNEKLKLIEKHFVWLTEIPEEIEKKYSDKSNSKLNPLPKTPAVKRRAQNRARLKAIQENASDVDTPSDIEPKKILIEESPILLEESPRGRPKRDCRKRTRSTTSILSGKTRSSRNAVTVVSKLQTATSKKVTKVEADVKEEQSSNDSCVATPTVGVNKNVQLSHCDENTPKSTHIGKKDIKNNATISSPKMTQAKLRLAAENVEADLPSTSRLANCRVDMEVAKDQSPSVRDRAQAYETMLNQKTIASSPTKTQRALTPSSAGRNFASATISSLAKSSPKLATTLEKPSPAKSTPRSSRRLSSRKSKRSSRCSSRTSARHLPPSKPTRTKLALKKKKSAERASKTVECDKENILSPSVVSKRASRSSLQSRDSAFVSNGQHSDSSHKAPSSSEDDDRMSSGGEQIDNEREEAMDEDLDETHVEKVETKVTQVETETLHTHESSDIEEDDSKDDSVAEGNATFTKDSPVVAANPPRTTRTRSRTAQQEVVPPVSSPQSFTELKSSGSADSVDDKPTADEEPRSTRTRTRVQKQADSEKKPEDTCETRSTRSRARLVDASKNVPGISVRDVSVITAQKAPTALLAEDQQGQMRTTRSRMRQGGAEPVPCGGLDEVVAGSPAIKSPSDARPGRKRPVEEYGNSPRPKRSRSCAGLAAGNSTFNTQSILLTSSPRGGNDEGEHEDTVNSSLMSPVRQCSRPYIFTSAQMQMSSFMKRSQAFAKTSNKVYSFMGSTTPTQNNSRALSSFLKRNTPTSKNTQQMLQEQKMLKLQEKENKERERLRRAAEMKKQKLEEQKRLRDDRQRKVAEAREMKMRHELEQKERINKKFEDKAVLKDRMLEEKLKAENEKKEIREKKQMEANSRRRLEEEERIKKRAELDEEAKRQQEWMQRKKEFEEEERRRHLDEEKRKQEERLQKMHEEKMKLKKLDDEKKERMRKERERQLALEKAEKERVDREKREERERRLEEQRRLDEKKRVEELRRIEEKRKAEEQEKIRLMEAAHKRAQEEAMRLQKEREAKKAELQKLISQCKGGTALNTSTGANSSMNNYMITPDGKKAYKPSINPNNYEIGDKQSDDSTDEEDAPKKKIPDWAMGVPLNTALIRQYTHPPDVNKIFLPHLVEAPDLAKLFPTSRHRHKFHYRTSSAIWTSPAMKQKP